MTSSSSDLDFRAAVLGRKSEKERRWCESTISSPDSVESRRRLLPPLPAPLEPQGSFPSSEQWSPPLRLAAAPVVKVEGPARTAGKAVLLLDGGLPHAHRSPQPNSITHPPGLQQALAEKGRSCRPGCFNDWLAGSSYQAVWRHRPQPLTVQLPLTGRFPGIWWAFALAASLAITSQQLVTTLHGASAAKTSATNQCTARGPLLLPGISRWMALPVASFLSTSLHSLGRARYSKWPVIPRESLAGYSHCCPNAPPTLPRFLHYSHLLHALDGEE